MTPLKKSAITTSAKNCQSKAAIEDTISFVKTKSRAWVDSGLEKANDYPYTIAAARDLEIHLHATEALLEKAGIALDHAVENPKTETVAKAQIAVSASKVLSFELSIAATNKLFERAGIRELENVVHHALPLQSGGNR